jgi:hypothetical protein
MEKLDITMASDYCRKNNHDLSNRGSEATLCYNCEWLVHVSELKSSGDTNSAEGVLVQKIVKQLEACVDKLCLQNHNGYWIKNLKSKLGDDGCEDFEEILNEELDVETDPDGEEYERRSDYASALLQLNDQFFSPE